MRNWKVLTFAALSLALAAAPVFAQNPIPNPGFESWTVEGEPVGWMTTNAGVPGTITQSADAHSGSSAIQGNVIEIFPGFNAQPYFQTGENGEGFPTTTRWGSLDGFYKFTAVGGDQVLISAALFKDSTAAGVGSIIISAAASTYTAFSVPIFWANQEAPDSCIIYAFLIGPSQQGGTPHLGSSFLFDDLSMGMGAPPVCPITLTGDVNAAGGIVTSDIIYLVNFVLKGGPAPLPCTAAGDVNCAGGVATSDIIYLVNFVLKGGPAPCDACSLVPGTWSCP